MKSEKSTTEYIPENWRDRQEYNLQNLWRNLKNNEETILREFDPLNKIRKKQNRLSDLENVGYEYPSELDEKNLIHMKFCEEIVHDYGKIIEKPKGYDKCLYKPESILPYPKEYIRKALKYTCNILNEDRNNPSVEMMITNIEITEMQLMNFVDIDEKDLPKNAKENLEAVKEYNNKLDK